MMSSSASLPNRFVTRRMNRIESYLFVAEECQRRGVRCADSREIGRATGLRPEVVRRDLRDFGVSGTPGRGFDPGHIASVLRRRFSEGDPAAVLVGAGARASLVLQLIELGCLRLELVGRLEPKPARHRDSRPPTLSCQRLHELAETMPLIAVVASDTADDVADSISDCFQAGIRVFWSFNQVRLDVPAGCRVRHERFSEALAAVRP